METIKWILAVLTALAIANGVVWLLVEFRFGAGETDKIKSTHVGRSQSKYQSNYTARSALHGTVSAN